MRQIPVGIQRVTVDRNIPSNCGAHSDQGWASRSSFAAIEFGYRARFGGDLTATGFKDKTVQSTQFGAVSFAIPSNLCAAPKIRPTATTRRTFLCCKMNMGINFWAAELRANGGRLPNASHLGKWPHTPLSPRSTTSDGGLVQRHKLICQWNFDHLRFAVPDQSCRLEQLARYHCSPEADRNDSPNATG